MLHLNIVQDPSCAISTKFSLKCNATSAVLQDLWFCSKRDNAVSISIGIMGLASLTSRFFAVPPVLIIIMACIVLR